MGKPYRAALAGHRIRSLDSLRGLAALTVCLFHAGAIKVSGIPVVSEHGWLGVLFNGHGAIILFFVLSGFVLAGALDRTPEPHALNYILVRLFRLYPIVISSVAAMAAVRWIFYAQITSIDEFLRNAALLESTLVGPLWTLQVEVWGSALILVAFEIERRFGLGPVTVLCGVLTILSFAGGATRTAPGIDTAFLYPFLIGYLLARVKVPAFSVTGAAWVTLLTALVAFYAAHAYGNVLKQWLLLATALAAGAIILALREPKFCNLLQSAPLRMLGACSYSFYAFHAFGIMAAVEVAEAGIGPVGTVLVALGVASFLAVPAYILIERPGVRVGRRIAAARRFLSDIRE